MFNHILVTTDGSQTSHHALPYAADLARQYHSALTLLYVMPLPPVPYAEGAAYALNMAEEGERLRSEAERVLSEASALLDLPGHQTASVEGTGGVASAIAEEVQRRGATLVVMGTHGRSGLAKVLLGSVAQSVLHRVDVPVLLVRSPKPPSGDRS